MRSIASSRSNPSERASTPDAQHDYVALLRWPQDHRARAALGRAQLPRLLFLAEGQAPPARVHVLEDWTRSEPGSDEARARAKTLASRSTSLPCGLRLSNSALRRGEREVSLSPAQVAAAAVLIRLAGRPVSRALVAEALKRNGTPVGPPALRSLLTRLDGALAPLRLRVHLLSRNAVMLELEAQPVS